MSAVLAGGTARYHHRNAALLLAFCALLWSSAGVMTRHLQAAEGFEVTFWRSFFCVIGVTLALAWRTGGRPLAPVIAMGLPGLVSGVMWAVMFTCYMLALTRTSVEFRNSANVCGVIASRSAARSSLASHAPSRRSVRSYCARVWTDRPSASS